MLQIIFLEFSASALAVDTMTRLMVSSSSNGNGDTLFPLGFEVHLVRLGIIH